RLLGMLECFLQSIAVEAQPTRLLNGVGNVGFRHRMVAFDRGDTLFEDAGIRVKPIALRLVPGDVALAFGERDAERGGCLVEFRGDGVEPRLARRMLRRPRQLQKGGIGVLHQSTISTLAAKFSGVATWCRSCVARNCSIWRSVVAPRRGQLTPSP